jgi:hypothetical protein
VQYLLNLFGSTKNFSDFSIDKTLFISFAMLQGPSFFLEDGHSCLSINDASMWAKVNPFSPLGSGMRLNPF